jgi:hypothetical protein
MYFYLELFFVNIMHLVAKPFISVRHHDVKSLIELYVLYFTSGSGRYIGEWDSNLAVKGCTERIVT